jgi:hypothetical protein
MNPIAAKAAEVAAKAALKEARAWIAKYHVEALWDDQLIALAQHGTDGERRLAFPEINRRLKERRDERTKSTEEAGK